MQMRTWKSACEFKSNMGRALFSSLGVYNSIKENRATVLIALLKAANVVRNDIEWVSQKVAG